MSSHLPRQKDSGNRPVLVWNKHQIYPSTLHVLGNCPGSRDRKLMLILNLAMGIVLQHSKRPQHLPGIWHFRGCSDLQPRKVPVLEVLQLSCKMGWVRTALRRSDSPRAHTGSLHIKDVGDAKLKEPEGKFHQDKWACSHLIKNTESCSTEGQYIKTLLRQYLPTQERDKKSKSAHSTFGKTEGSDPNLWELLALFPSQSASSQSSQKGNWVKSQKTWLFCSLQMPHQACCPAALSLLWTLTTKVASL